MLQHMTKRELIEALDKGMAGVTDSLDEQRANQGGPVGHYIAGSMFLIIGFGHLILTVLRSRKLTSSNDFMAVHVPERNPNVLLAFG